MTGFPRFWTGIFSFILLAALLPSSCRSAAPANSAHYYDQLRQKRATISALGKKTGGESAQALSGFLTDPDSHVRMHAAHALIPLGEANAAILPQLTAALADDNTGVRQNILAVLMRLGQAARPALPKIKKLLSDPDTGVAQNAKAAVTMVEGSLAHAGSAQCKGDEARAAQENAAMSDAEKRTVNAVLSQSESRVIVYGHRGCGWTAHFLKTLKSSGTVHELRDVTQSAEAAAEYRLMLRSHGLGDGYPTWVFRGKAYLGADTKKLHELKGNTR